MDWIDAIMLPAVMIAWRFLSYDAVNRLCVRLSWKMRAGAGMILWIAVGFCGGAYLMHLFNALQPSAVKKGTAMKAVQVQGGSAYNPPDHTYNFLYVRKVSFESHLSS